MQNGQIFTTQLPSQKDAAQQVDKANGYSHIDRPPDIPHITERFIPISHIALVLARSGYSDLCKLRQNLIDVPDQKRKKRIVDYAAKYRAEVVKLLVLIGWAARADEVSIAIDVRAWLQGQKNCFDNLYGSIRYDVLKNLESAKVLGPHISTAIDVLTTNSVPQLQVTDIAKAFQVKEPLGIAGTLRTLRTLDTLISLRLLLYECLPVAMQDYKVGSGRVTFTVNNEFSVDLFFATEDVASPSLQWFMIDFRFAFTAEDAIETPMSLKLEIENISNALLAKTLAESDGKHQLVELYNFLHSFTIQYKLERLFSQFSLIGSREKGRIDIKYASAQKILAVGFWLSKRHREKKSVLNSLTVTIVAGADSSQERFLSGPRTSHEYNRERLKCIVRLGEQEQSTDQIIIEQHNASSLLSAVVANRVSALLRDIQAHLVGYQASHSIDTSVRIRSSRLEVHLIRDALLAIAVDEYDGTYLVSLQINITEEGQIRPTDTAAHLQNTLNELHDPRDIAYRIHNFKVNYIKRDLESQATASGWTMVTFPPSSVFQNEFSTAFQISGQKMPIAFASCLFFTRTSEGWKNTNTELSSSWFLLVNCSSNSIHFWLLEMCIQERSSKWQILWVQRLPIDVSVVNLSADARLDTTSFDKLWRLCTARILSLHISRGLGERGISHVYSRRPAGVAWTSLDVPDIVFATDDIGSAKMSWTSPLLTVRIPSLCRDILGTSLVQFTCERLADLPFDLSSCQDAEFQVEGHHLSFEFSTRVSSQSDEDVLQQFLNKWRLLTTNIAMVKAAGMLQPPFGTQSVDARNATFAYASGKYLIRFQQQPSLLDEISALTVSLGASNSRHNPHMRIAQHLNSLVCSFKDNMGAFFRVMMLTLPVLETLDRIEQESFTDPECYIKVRSVGTYRIYYPRQSAALLIRARPAPKIDMLPEPYKKLANTTVWHFTDASKSSTPIPGQNLISSCSKFFNEGMNDVLHTDLTFPEGSGIGCAPDLASEVLYILHKTIMDEQHGAAHSQMVNPKQNRPVAVSDNANTIQTSQMKKKSERSSNKKTKSALAESTNGHKQNAAEVIEIL